jgi:hypothetical protein
MTSVRELVRLRARQRLAKIRGEPPPPDPPDVAGDAGEVSDEELAQALGAKLLREMPPDDLAELRRWATRRKRGQSMGEARAPRRPRKRELPRCGAATHPRMPCPACGEGGAKAGRDCPSCGERLPLGPPCKAPPVRDPGTGQPVNGRCRVHGGTLRGPQTPEGRARANANLRRGTRPGPGERRGGGDDAEA